MNPFNIGFLEILVILIIALIVFGPQRLIEIGTELGKALGEFRRGLSNVGSVLEEEQGTPDDRPTPKEVPRELSEEELPPEEKDPGESFPKASTEASQEAGHEEETDRG